MILSLALGKDLEELARMPAKSYARYRRFYARHPFGLVRGDMRAWLAGSLVRAKGIEAEDAVRIIEHGLAPRARKPKRRGLPKGKLLEHAMAIGATVKGE